MLGQMTDESPSWEYVPGFETPESYQAFEFYRDSDPRFRSLTNTASALGKTYAAVWRWSHLYLWAERVQSYDTHRAREREALRREAEASADRKWADERAELLHKLGALVNQGLLKTLHDLQSGRITLRPNELKQLTDVLLKYANLANGDATDKVDVTHDLSNMSDEQLASLSWLRDMKGQKE